MAISCGCGYARSQPYTSCMHFSAVWPSLSFRPLPPTSFPRSTAISLSVIICYYITQTAPGHQSRTEHTQNGLIIPSDRAISPLMISLAYTLCTQSETEVLHCTLLKGLQTKLLPPPRSLLYLHQHSIRLPLTVKGDPVGLLCFRSAGGPWPDWRWLDVTAWLGADFTHRAEGKSEENSGEDMLEARRFFQAYRNSTPNYKLTWQLRLEAQ